MVLPPQRKDCRRTPAKAGYLITKSIDIDLAQEESVLPRNLFRSEYRSGDARSYTPEPAEY